VLCFAFRRLVIWLHNGWRIICRPVHEAGHRVGFHLVCWEGLEEGVELLRLYGVGIEPGLFIGAGENNRHPVVDGGEQFVWFGGDNRATHQLLAVLPSPHIVDASKGEDIFMFQLKQVGDFGISGALPLVKKAGGNKTPLRPKRFAEGGFVGDALSAGIDLRLNGCTLARPKWHQAPLHQGKGVLGGNDRNSLAGSDIVPGPQGLGRRGQHQVIVVPFGEFIWRGEAVSSAHRLRTL
jgi:hypothetical protein